MIGPMRANQSVSNRPFSRPTLNAQGQSDIGSLFASDTRKPGDREAAILWVRMQMARNGISYDDLLKAGCFQSNPEQTVCYRNADGRWWDGKGEMPDWLQRAVNAGQSIEHFKVR